MGGSGREYARCSHLRVEIWGTRQSLMADFMSRLQRSGVLVVAYLDLHRPSQQAGRDDPDPG
jgi:hypothetical protein